MTKIAIITTHPIQYNAPFFRLLAQEKGIQLKVFYTWGQSQEAVYDPDFGHTRTWDIPLLEGYDYCFLQNTAKQPGSHHFRGIINPTAIQEISAWQPTIVWVYGWAFISHLQILRHFHGKVPVWFRGDSTLLDEPNNWKSKLKKIVLTKIYSYIDVAWYAGTNNKAYFKAYGLEEHQLAWMPHAVDNQRFGADRTAEARQWKQELGIPETDNILLFAGKFSPKKNPLGLLKAFQKAALTKWHLVFCGNGPLEDDLKKEAGIAANIHFCPFQNQSQMPVVYQACDVFCLPSVGPGETWGLAINEAMAAGKPVIATDKCGGSIDLIKDSVTGWLIPYNNSDSLTRVLCSLKTPALPAMGKNAKDTIKSFSFERASFLIVVYIENKLSFPK